MKQKIIIPSLLAIILLGMVYIYIQLNIMGIDPLSDFTGKILENVGEIADNPRPGDIEYLEDADKHSAGGAGDEDLGGSGRTPDQDSTGSQITCVIEPLPYALKKPTTLETCNSYSGESCVDKTVICKVEAHNLEYANSGDFEIKTSIVNESYGEVYSTSETKVILPQSHQEYTAQESFQGENADQILTCFFNTISVPEGEICS